MQQETLESSLLTSVPSLEPPLVMGQWETFLSIWFWDPAEPVPSSETQADKVTLRLG